MSTGFDTFRIRPVADCFGISDKHSDSIKGDCQLFKEDYASRISLLYGYDVTRNNVLASTILCSA
jgi:hypothetical protein